MITAYGYYGDPRLDKRRMLMNIREGSSYDVFASPNRRRHALLIVDTDAPSLLYISMLLQRFDFQTETAKTAQEAFEITTTAKPALIITAMRLNGMNGLNFITLLRKNPKTTNIPFIALRNPGDYIEEKHCFSAGAVDCLVKPISAELLYRAVQGGLEDRPRAAMRFRTIQPVWVDTVPFDGGEDIHTLDISERGLFLRTAKPAPENTHLSLRINLNGRIIKAEAKVVYTCQPCKGPYNEAGAGLQFTNLSPNDLKLLRKFIRTKITRGIVPEQDLSSLPTDHASE
jgi:CheY-like chemotaxis protein